MKTSFLTTLQRILAIIIDIFLISIIVAIFILAGFSTFATVLYVILLLSFPFRDIIFGGRSIGKRLLRLVIINTDDENCFDSKVPIGRMFLRQVIFIFAGIVEFFVLLITGKTLGDRVSNTAVVSKNRMDDHMLYFEERKQLKERENKIAQEVEQHRLVEERRRLARNGGVPQAPSAPKSTNIYAPENQQVHYYEKTPMSTRKKVIISVVAVLLVAILVFVGINIIPDVIVKSSDGYKAAHEYLLNTYTFSGLDAKKSDIEFVTMVKRQAPSNPNPQERIILEYHFKLKGEYVKVYCHEYNGKVTVCRSCTQIK